MLSLIPRLASWPQILSQPEYGIARVSSDGRNIAYVSQGSVVCRGCKLCAGRLPTEHQGSLLID